MGIFPVDIPRLIHSAISDDARAPDGKLHASSLTEPLRHTQLGMIDAPRKPSSFTDDVPLMTGTLWHRWIEENVIRRINAPVATELNVSEGMPEGWSGTVDWLIWHPEYQAFVLGDLKTIKGAGLPWVLRDGAKREHIWQLSSYWYALRNMGYPLVEGYGILYLPKDGVAGKDLEPTVMECNMIDEVELLSAMWDKKRKVDEFVHNNSELAPIPEREQSVVWNKKASVHDVVLKPHYSASYCKYVDCGCSEQGQTKIGHVDLEGVYHPRKGYEEYEYSSNT